MSGFALPPDPGEKKKKQQVAEEKAQTPPEKDALHRMLFAMVVYLSIIGLLLFSVPAVGAMFAETMSDIPEPEDTSPAISSLWQAMDMLYKVRRNPRTEEYSFDGFGSHWYTFLAPLLLIVLIQVAFKDKQTAATAHYYFAVLMGVVLIMGCVLLLFELLGQRPGDSPWNKGGLTHHSARRC